MKIKKRSFFVICLAQWIVLLFLLASIMYGRHNHWKSTFRLSDMQSDRISYENDVWYADEDTAYADEDTPLLYGPCIELARGSYTVSVRYACESDQNFQPSAGSGNDVYIKAGRASLPASQTRVSYSFDLTEDIDDFELSIYYNGIGSFQIQEITLEENMYAVQRLFVILLAVFVCVDIWLFFYKKAAEKKQTLRILLGIACLSSLPLFTSGIGWGHDIGFHLMRIEGLAQEIGRGIVPVRISSLFLEGYGYPPSIYYGDLLLYVPALLRLVGFSMVSAYKAYVFGINLATSLVSYLCFARIFSKRKIAYAACLVYMTASYRLINLYVRAAVGEYSAMLFFPLIALAVYRIYTKDPADKKVCRDNAAMLAVGMSGLLTTHILSAEMVVAVLALICLVLAKKTFRLAVLRTYFVAVIETCLFSLYFLIPFLDYFFCVESRINGGVGTKIQGNGVGPASFFAFFKNIYSVNSIHVNPVMQLTPGLVLMAALIFGVVLWSRGQALIQTKLFIGLSVFLLYAATDWFPWNRLAARSIAFKLLAQVQFPWRYIGIAVLVLTLLFGFLLKQAPDLLYAFWQKAVYMLAVGTSVLMVCYLTGNYLDDAQMLFYYDTAEKNTNTVGGGEYMRKGSQKERLSGKLQTENMEKAEVLLRDGCRMELYCKAGNDGGAVEAPMFHYKGYVVRDEEGRRYTIQDGENNTIRFELPAGYEGKVTIDFKEPWYWKLAAFISCLSVIGLAAWYALAWGRNSFSIWRIT